FQPGSELKWTLRTESEAVQALIQLREVLWIQQGEFGNHDDLQAESHELVTTLISSSPHSHLADSFATYSRFCQLGNVPVFPVTPPLLALCLVSYCAEGGNAVETIRTDLNEVAELTHHLWEDEPKYCDLRTVDGAEKALRDLVKVDGIERGEPSPNIGGEVNLLRRNSGNEAERLDDASCRARSPGTEPRLDDRELGDGAAAGRYGRRARSADGEVVAGPPAKRVKPALRSPTVHAARVHDGAEAGAPWVLFFAVVKAVFSVYGIACRWSNTNGRPAQIRCGRYGDTTFDGDKCTFLLITDRDAKTKRWSLDAARSNSIHLHGPDARFIADPTWRPHLPDPIARAAIGTGEASSTALKRGS
ncbi:hypothetical protein DMC30DRAFT_339251, partial [Rhodotorula diobovata]